VVPATGLFDITKLLFGLDYAKYTPSLPQRKEGNDVHYQHHLISRRIERTIFWARTSPLFLFLPVSATTE
jgi:hypothetical protein